jgi:hypothetical protein
MNNHGKILTALLMASAPALATAANQSYPSFGFVQEMAGVAANGDIQADIYNSTGYPSHLRIGAFGGELMIDPNTAPFSATGIGYKFPVNPNVAIYGKLFLNSATGGQTNITLGASYTGQSGDLIYNGNGHLTNANPLNESTLLLNGGGFYRLKTQKMGGKTYLGGELSLKLSPSPTETNIFLGARWQPKKAVLVDLGVLAPIGGSTTVMTPAFVRLNLGF